MEKRFSIMFFSVILLFCIILSVFIVVRVYHTFLYGNDDYYSFYSNNYDDSLVSVDNTLDKSDDNDSDNEEYKTAINHSNKYNNQHIKNEGEAISLIKSDSLKEESKCNNDFDAIYEKIRNKTGIYGVNLCELSSDKVYKIYDVLDYVYTNYPFISDYVTNLTLVNDGGVNSYIAAFKPAFTFATSDSDNKFPFVIKIQVFLNSSYYLNDKYFNLIIERSKNTGYFPNNTSYDSLVAHEFGHVITYILAIKYYNSMNTLYLPFDNFSKYSSTLKEYSKSNFSKLIVDEAYENLKENNYSGSKEDFRKGISGYANSYDNEGNVIYNETIAEAFHDYYLNHDNASKNSIEIVNVLNKYIEELN